MPLKGRHAAFRRAFGKKNGRAKRLVLKLGVVLGVMVLVMYYGATYKSAVADEQTSPVTQGYGAEVMQARRLSSTSCSYNESETSWWANVLYAIALLYALLGLAIVCDDFFVASLEMISDALKLSEDVAGATFMAAGSSAPELFTSVMDTFGSENNIGVGTIVGSAVFNILVIIAAAAAASDKPLHIDWRPLTRDSLFYLISIVLLIVFISPPSAPEGCKPDSGKIYWWGSLCLVAWYAAYILFMWKNQAIFDWVDRKMGVPPKVTNPDGDVELESQDSNATRERKTSIAAAADALAAGWSRPNPASKPPPTEADVERVREVLAAREFLKGRGILPATELSIGRRRLRAAIISVVAFNYFSKKIGASKPAAAGAGAGESKEAAPADVAVVVSGAVPSGEEDERKESVPADSGLEVRKWLADLDPDMSRYADLLIGDGFDTLKGLNTIRDDDLERLGIKTGHRRHPFAEALAELRASFAKGGDGDGDDDDDDEDEGAFAATIDWFSKPWMLMFRTIPDCAEEKWAKWYVLTFIMSIVWIGIISWILVEMATRIGCSLGISAVLMGLTVLAAGTSVPDALGSMVVARQGMGDMAVGNAIGSNVFDICLGIGLPYVVKTGIVDPLSDGTGFIAVEGENITGPVLILLGTLIIVVVALALNKWKLTRPVGLAYMLAYAGFVVYNVVFEATKPELTVCT